MGLVERFQPIPGVADAPRNLALDPATGAVMGELVVVLDRPPMTYRPGRHINGVTEVAQLILLGLELLFPTYALLPFGVEIGRVGATIARDTAARRVKVDDSDI